MASPPGMSKTSTLGSRTSCSSYFPFPILLSEDRMERLIRKNRLSFSGVNRKPLLSEERGAAIRTKHPNLSIAIYNGIRSNSKPV